MHLHNDAYTARLWGIRLLEAKPIANFTSLQGGTAPIAGDESKPKRGRGQSGEVKVNGHQSLLELLKPSATTMKKLYRLVGQGAGGEFGRTQVWDGHLSPTEFTK